MTPKIIKSLINNQKQIQSTKKTIVMSIKTSRMKSVKEIQDTKQESISNEIIQNKPIEGTPFNAVKLDNKWFVVCGRVKSKALFNTYDECVNYAQNPDWDLYMVVATSVSIEIRDNKLYKSN